MSKRWANKMKMTYIAGFSLLIIALIAPSVIKYMNKPATCSDGIQNQGETAIDLGGPCEKLNPKDLNPLVIDWSRAFKVATVEVPPEEGSASAEKRKAYIYSAVAYVENSNRGAGIRKLGYTFKLYDDKGVYITEKSGETFIPPNKIVPIFEGGFEVGLRKPLYTKFTLNDNKQWERMEDTLSTDISVDNKAFKEISGQARLSADVHNKGVYTLRRLVIVAVLFDKLDNAIGASRTIIDRLPADSTKQVVFTWPQAFNGRVSKIDIVPLLPDIDSL